MRRFAALLNALLAAVAAAAPGAQAPTAMVEVSGGSVTPFLRVAGEGATVVAPFRIDATPVTNAHFLAFVIDEPAYRADAIPTLFAARGYLRHWAGPTDLGGADPDAPVVHVSWFAATAFCEARGLRLPSEAEWELVARASDSDTDGRGDPAFAQDVLARTTSSGPLQAVGRDAPNAFGLHDLHRLFEWVDDVHASLAALDGRNDADPRLAAVCGGAAEGAADRRDYAAFLRVTLRTALPPAGHTAHLGFRCAGP